MDQTAIIVIHGMGEQQPMGTVRSFVRFFAGRFFRSKPDPFADSFELRRLSTYSSSEKAVAEACEKVPHYPPDTTFYEFYWASHYRDTKPLLVIFWTMHTLWGLFRSGQVCRTVRKAPFLAMAFILALPVGIFFLVAGISDLINSDQGVSNGIPKVLFGLFLPLISLLIQSVFLRWIGDAARYFGTSPENPVERQQIRAEGVKLLKQLHEERVSKDGKNEARYERIVMVGHSLGSVIAYDIIMHYWKSINREILIESELLELLEIEGLTGEIAPTENDKSWEVPAGANTAKYGNAQTKLMNKLKADAWRVTDLVTLGSPLTYARFLLATDGKELNEHQAQRELATCPPMKDERPDHMNRKRFVYSFNPTTREPVVPHHAAPFLLTRWTNIYFPSDPIGGKLGPLFGWGILDVPVSFDGKHSQDSGKVRRMRSWFRRFFNHIGGAHVRYWELLDDKPKSPLSNGCATVLRAVIQNKWPWV